MHKNHSAKHLIPHHFICEVFFFAMLHCDKAEITEKPSYKERGYFRPSAYGEVVKLELLLADTLQDYPFSHDCRCKCRNRVITEWQQQRVYWDDCGLAAPWEAPSFDGSSTTDRSAHISPGHCFCDTNKRCALFTRLGVSEETVVTQAKVRSVFLNSY